MGDRKDSHICTQRHGWPRTDSKIMPSLRDSDDLSYVPRTDVRGSLMPALQALMHFSFPGGGLGARIAHCLNSADAGSSM